MKVTKLNQLLNEIRQGDNIELLDSIVHDINSYDGSLDHLDYWNNDDEFFDCVFNSKLEAVRACCYGEYNYTDEYIKLDGYGNLKSVSQWDYEAELKGDSNSIAEEFERLINDNNLNIDDYDDLWSYDEDMEEEE